MLAVNIIASVVLAILTSWFGLFALCQYDVFNFCYHDYAYFITGGATAAVILLLFFIQQYANTQTLLQPRQRNKPHFIGRYSVFERSAQTIWNIWNPDDKLTKSIVLPDLSEVGWIVEYDLPATYPVIISQQEFYYWLLEVAKRQQQLEVAGKKSVISPLGGRNNPELSRKRLDAYINMLESIDAIEYVNANVKRLKPSYASDVWSRIILPLECIRPLIKI